MANKKQRVLLIGWDAADWKVISPLVDKGLMPNMAKLVENGVMGNLATLNPILSPMLWTSIATGKRPYKHGIHGFSEPDPQTGTVRPITNLSRKTKAVWNILNQHDKKSLVVGWWPSSPAEPINGVMVSNHFQQAVSPLDKPWPIRPGTVHPASLNQELAPLRVHPHEVPGDSLRYFVPNAPEIDQEKDKRLEQVAKITAECSGVQAAATHLMETNPDWDFAAVYFDGIDHYGHGFMKFHPPRLDWIDEKDFETYKEVVNGGYIFHDMILGRLMEMAGPETTVMLISDHGFHPDHLRPKSLPNEPAGPAAEHREFGIFVASGPGIKKDDLVFGASLLDVTPTILSLFGLPTGRDMDGRVLTSIYSEPIAPEFIESWDLVEGNDGRHPPETQIDPADAQEAIQQLVDLGYIDEPDADKSKAIDETNRELEYNLARAYFDGGKFAEAAELFSTNWEKWPEESRFGVHLLQTHLQMEDPIEARKTMTLLRTRKQEAIVSANTELKELLESLRQDFPLADEQKQEEQNTESADSQDVDSKIDWEKVPDNKKRQMRRLRSRAGLNPHAFAYLEGSLLRMEGRYDDALETLRQAVSAQTSNLPSLYLQMGEVCLEKQDWLGAEDHFRNTLDLNELNAKAHFGLARIAVHGKNWKRALKEAQTAIGQLFHYAPSHYIAGLAQWRLGNSHDALKSLRRAVAINPAYPQAHETLAKVLREFDDEAGYREHMKLSEVAHDVKKLRQAMGVEEPVRKLVESMSDPSLAGVASMEQASDGSASTNSDHDSSVRLPPLEDSIVIVTGLPRSGTSMMMQMLDAGGVPVFVDNNRPADQSNEKGYFEHEYAKKLMTDASWIGEAKGQAIKVIAQLLRNLSAEQRYRIVFMHRPLDEVVSSQRKMLERLGKQGGTITEEALKATFQKQLAQGRTMLEHYRKQGLLDIVDVHYHDVLQNPGETSLVLKNFLGEEFDSTAASQVVDKTMNHESCKTRGAFSRKS